MIKAHNSNNNIIKLLNIIQLSEQQQIDDLVLSLDAEKAFDRVEWSYFLHQITLADVMTLLDWLRSFTWNQLGVGR